MARSKLDYLFAAVSVLLLVSPLIAYLTGNWVGFWRLATNLGDEPAYVALAVVLYFLVDQGLGFSVLLALSTTAWLNVVVKNTLRLPRPPRELWLANAEGYGFPSGHSQTSTTFWSSLSLKTRRLGVVVLGVAVVAIVGASRIMLNVHYPWDVAGGIALGLAVSYASYYLFDRLPGKASLSSAILAVYGLAVGGLYLVVADATIARIGGLIVGLSVYPLVSEKVSLAGKPLAWRAVLAAVALVVAMLLTTVAKAQPVPVQFIAYLATGATVVSLPLLLKRAEKA